MIPIPRDILNESMRLKHYARENADILYFGDSITFFSAPGDKIPNSMQGILGRLLHTKIFAIANAAFDMVVYYDICKHLFNEGYRPKIVIVPINIRSFGLEWDKNPSWQFMRKRKIWMLQDSLILHFFKPLSVFKYDQPPLTKMAYENLGVFDGDRLVGRVRDFEVFSTTSINDEMRKKLIIFRYFYPLSSDHPKIKVLQELADLLKSQGIKGIFYITPVDYQTGEYYMGNKFSEQIKEKVQIIKEALAKRDTEVLDFSFFLSAKFFNSSPSTDSFMTEHLKFEGRASVVAYLLRAMIEAQDLNIPHP